MFYNVHVQNFIDYHNGDEMKLNGEQDFSKFKFFFFFGKTKLRQNDFKIKKKKKYIRSQKTKFKLSREQVKILFTILLFYYFTNSYIF